jgi:hypothetical protein
MLHRRNFQRAQTCMISSFHERLLVSIDVLLSTQHKNRALRGVAKACNRRCAADTLANRIRREVCCSLSSSAGEPWAHVRVVNDLHAAEEKRRGAHTSQWVVDRAVKHQVLQGTVVGWLVGGDHAGGGSVVEVSNRRAASYALSAFVHRHTRWRHRHHRRYGCSHHECDSVEPNSAQTHKLHRNLLRESKCSCGHGPCTSLKRGEMRTHSMERHANYTSHRDGSCTVAA